MSERDGRTATEVEADKNAADARAVLAAGHSAEKDAFCIECGDHRGWRVEPDWNTGEAVQVQCRACTEHVCPARVTSPAKCDNCGGPITTYDPDCCHVAGCHECVLPPAEGRA